MFLEGGQEPPLVKLDTGNHIWRAFERSRMVKRTTMGEIPLEWADVLHFAQSTGRLTEHWELEILFDMSDAYFANRERGKSPFARSPLEMEPETPIELAEPVSN